jgi:hypothetical protein
MLKYRGTYRVVFETDKRTGKAQEFAFIPCRIKKGANICRHNENTLNVYIPSIKIINSLLKEYPDIFIPFQIGNLEGTLLFKEPMLPHVAAILKPYVKGKNKSPRPKRQVNISEKRKKELSDRMRRLHADGIIGGKARKTEQIPFLYKKLNNIL